MDPEEFQLHVELRRAYGQIDNAILICAAAARKAGNDQFKLVVINKLVADLKAATEPLIPILFQNHEQ